MKNNHPPYQLIVSLLFLIAVFITGCNSKKSGDYFNWDGILKTESDFTESHFEPYEPKIKQNPLIEFVVNEKDSLNVAYSNHLEKVADYSKIPFQKISLTNWNTNAKINSSTRVLCLMETKDIQTKTIDSILHFIARGGTVFVAQSITDERFVYLAGIKKTGDLDTDITSKGIHFTTDFLPNVKGKTIKENFTHFGLTQNNFSNSISIKATASNNPNLPIVIENKISKGKLLFFNSTAYLDKEDRGLLFSFVLSGLEGIPYPIANTSTLFLDDFPSPIFDAKLEPIASEMNMKTGDFVTKIWWPDIKYLSKKYHISMTAIPCFDYENTTSPPFDFEQWDSRKIKTDPYIDATSSWLMKDCMANGNELGFHGYNHVSLEKSGWKKEYIPIALQAVEKKWKINDFGELPLSYVPPSNIIDKMGVGQLRKGLPSLRFMCSLYSGEKYEGGDREFDFEPYDPTLFDYPRLTAGFYMDEDRKYSQQSLYLYTGIWTHFIHPDDIYQINSKLNRSKGNFDLRNKKNLGWRKTKGEKGGMFYEFDHYLSEITHLFPKIRFLNAQTAGNLVYNWRATAFKHSETALEYAVKRNNQDRKETQYWFLYVQKKNIQTVENQLQKQNTSYSKTVFQEGYLFTILTNQGEISIDNIWKKESLFGEDLKLEFKKLKEINAKYVTDFKTNYDYVNGFSTKNGEAIELNLLKEKMQSEPQIDYATWNSYADFMLSKNKISEIWKLLKAKCKAFPSQKNINYSIELEKSIGYPNVATQEYWLYKQIEANPKNPNLLNDYLSNFNTAENAKKTTKVFQNLLKIDSNKANYQNYIEHLIHFEPKFALKILANKMPDENLKPLSESISWLFADNQEYKKALLWSRWTTQIDFKSKLYWYESLKEYDELETQYLIYISKNPKDYKTKSEMCRIYLDLNRVKEAWAIAYSLPNGNEKLSLQKTLNNALLDSDDKTQKEILNRYSAFILPEIKAKIIPNLSIK